MRERVLGIEGNRLFVLANCRVQRRAIRFRPERAAAEVVLIRRGMTGLPPGQRLILPDEEEVTFPIDPFSKTCLLNGVDELGYLLGLESFIEQYEEKSMR
jgi:hypothetical protein